MTILLKIVQVILILSILIIIHELGHFTFAKLFGIKVDKFLLFFDVKGVKLLSTRTGWFSRLFPTLKKTDTEYGIGWLPLGGYCKIAGMIDESMDTEQMKGEPRPWEFRTHPAWQRLLVMAGGVLYNFIFAIIGFILITGIWGETYISNKDVQIWASELAMEMGFRTGDRILMFDEWEPEDFSMLQADLARKSVRKATVLRGCDTVVIYIDRSYLPEVLNTPSMFSIAVPFVVDEVPEDSPNYGKGLERGDRIVAVAGTPIDFVQDSRTVMERHMNETLPITVVRNADTLQLSVDVDSSGRARIYAMIPGMVSKSYNAVSAIPAGMKLTLSTIGGYLRDLKMVATPSTGAYKSVGSFIAIGQAMPDRWNWYSFLYLLSLLSIMLGVMNLIPIPGLDGGHIVITIYEMITGHQPGERFLVTAQTIGMILIIALMILAFGNDIGRLFR